MDEKPSSARGVPAVSAEPMEVVDGPGPERSDEASTTSGLTPRELAILALEGRDWSHPGIKEETVRRELGLSAARYYQLVNALIDRPEALLHDPMLVRRLQRIRDARADARRLRGLDQASDPVRRTPPTRRRTGI